MLDLFKKILNLLKQWPSLFAHKEKTTLAKDAACCIEIGSSSFSIAYMRQEDNKNNLILCASYPYKTIEDLHNALITIIKYHKLETVPCAWILQPEQYQLLLIDALPVAPNEFQAAIRWKIKDLVRFPVNDALIDSFPLPVKKASSLQDMIMVVVAKLTDIKPRAEELEKCGMCLQSISISELSLTHIVAQYDDEKPLALLYMQEKSSQLIVTCKKLLYFSRRIEVGVNFFSDKLSENDSNQKIDRLALEVQRSFDFYQSQWRQPLPAKIIFSSIEALSLDITKLLTQKLSMQVEPIDLSTCFVSTNNINVSDGKYLSIIGGLFNSEGKLNATAN